MGRDTEFNKTKGTGGLDGRPDALVKVPGITHFSDNSLCSLSVSSKSPQKSKAGFTYLSAEVICFDARPASKSDPKSYLASLTRFSKLKRLGRSLSFFKLNLEPRAKSNSNLF
jgi:hypothetical protein